MVGAVGASVALIEVGAAAGALRVLGIGVALTAVGAVVGALRVPGIGVALTAVGGAGVVLTLATFSVLPMYHAIPPMPIKSTSAIRLNAMPAMITADEIGWRAGDAVTVCPHRAQNRAFARLLAPQCEHATSAIGVGAASMVKGARHCPQKRAPGRTGLEQRGQVDIANCLPQRINLGVMAYSLRRGFDASKADIVHHRIVAFLAGAFGHARIRN